jgi:hypothetical protein
MWRMDSSMGEMERWRYGMKSSIAGMERSMRRIERFISRMERWMRGMESSIGGMECSMISMEEPMAGNRRARREQVDDPR